MNRAFVLAFTSLVSACGADLSTPILTKDDARALAGKADTGGDVCDEYGWYGDGVCDDFCAMPDTADCGGAPTAPAEVFFTYAPRQCGTNPWEASDVAPSDDLSGELATVEGWLNSEGIEVLELGFLASVESRFVCRACSCPRGDRLVIKANDTQAAGLLARGFERLSVGAHTAPKQCGTNPWNESSTDSEQDLVATWARSQGVTLEEVGFLVKAEPMMVCMACSCPRGDTLFVIPAAGSDAAALGFQQL